MGDTDGTEVKKTVESEAERKNLPTYPLIRFADIPEDTKPEIIDLVTSAVEKYLTELDTACKVIKEEMDKIYGPFWHVVVGETFGFDVAYQTHHLLHMYYAGTLAVLLWKT